MAKKILTAIGSPMLNAKLKNTKDYEVLTEDIKIDEELIEWLERTGTVDILFLCSNIIQNYKPVELIEVIRKIQKDMLIVFFKEPNLEVSLKEEDNLKIYHNLNLDLDLLDEILQQTVSKNKSQIDCKTIAISGVCGVGKSTFSTFFAKNVENNDKKTLLVDFDLDENQIKTILKIKKEPQVSENITDMIININKNLDALCHLNLVFPAKNQINFFQIQELLIQLKQLYNFIIIDTSSKLENEYIKRIFYNSDNIVFLLEPNILGVKKSKNMIEILENDWKISLSKIKIILNKTNMYQISDSIIQELFPNIKLVGKMKYQDAYNLMINKSIDKKEIKKEYEKIYKKFC